VRRMDVEALKRKVCDEVDRIAGDLIEVSHSIHAHPELNFEEHHAHEVLTDAIARAGRQVERAAYEVATAFSSTTGTSGPAIGVLCEYDALPGIGHACGHNVIAAAGLGAGLAAALVAEEAGGRVVLMGTPAEEGGGGKIVMARRGAFDGLDAAMMVHPADADLIKIDSLAIESFEITFHGKAAHAAAAPHEGRNALDAAVLSYMNVAAMRQHIMPTERIHGIFTNGGGKPNIVPREAAMQWYVRSPTLGSLQPLKERATNCMQAGALACGCTLDQRWDGQPYADVRDNQAIVASYVANAARIGRTVENNDLTGRRVAGSTDMGNVSYLVPSIHPMVKVAPDGVPIHTEDFAAWARREEGDMAVIAGAKAMAMTVVDLWCSAELRASAQAEFAAFGPDRSVL
jgi:amidohydrolase